MTIKTALIAGALAAAAVAGPSLAQAPAAPQNRDCFYGGNVNGFRATDNSTVLLSIGTKQIYEVKLFSPSIDVKWANGIALVSRGGGNFICSNLDADLVIPSISGPERYPVTSIRHLTPAEIAAIPKKNLP
jgi:Family of unknown function (DUF6491)